MKRYKFHFYTRKFHRWMGVSIGIQLLLWTVGGLYFSWSDMDEVHGDYDKMPPPALALTPEIISPAVVLDTLKTVETMDSFADARLVNVLGKPYWQICFYEPGHRHPHKKFRLADAMTGALRPPLSEQEAVAVAQKGFRGNPSVKKVEFLEEVDDNHEYRENPLPAYAVTFDDARSTTVFVASELGTIQKFRNGPWRRFDFLWMLHTMDYASRDNITNWLLRAFSIFGLVTVCSGFTLFFISMKRRR